MYPQEAAAAAYLTAEPSILSNVRVLTPSLFGFSSRAKMLTQIREYLEHLECIRPTLTLPTKKEQ